MWFSLLVRFWKPLAGVALILGAGWYLHHAGYVSGRAAEKAEWQPRFAAAERERDAANARTQMKEADSILASAESQRRIDETLQNLHESAADADVRIRGLVRQLAARPRSCEVPAISGPTANPDAAAESEQRAEEAGGRIAGTGADCESDAATLAELQRWVMEQRAIFVEARTR